jgi:Skp family chaperone for outer membrane proteins
VKSKITGTYSNEEFTKFNEESDKIQKKLQVKVSQFQERNKTVIQEAQKNNDTAAMKKLRAEYDLIQKDITDYTFGYPKTHPKSFISVLILQMMVNNPKYTAKELESIYNALDESLKKTKPAKTIKENLDALKKKPAVKQP